MLVCTALLVFALSLQAPGAPPQPRPTAPVRDDAPRQEAAASDADATLLGTAWTAIGAGQFDRANAAADRVLAKRPWDRAALIVKIRALSGVAAQRGLEAYERWLLAGHADDAGLLEPVAAATAREIAAGPRTDLHSAAVRALIAARLTPPSQSTDLARADDATRMDLDIAAARSGDRGAVQRLTAMTAAPGGGSPALARAFAELGVSAGEPGLLLLTRSGNPQTRAAAVEALGGIKSEAGRAAAMALQKDPDPVVRTSSTIALAQMGDPTALSEMDRMIASNVPDLQIAAARAWEGRPGAWVDAIRPLLDNPDGLTRIEAARAIAPVDPDAARRVLGAALADSNPVIRYESAKVLEEAPPLHLAASDIATLRQRLRDADPSVRLSVAAALLRLARE